MPSLPEGRIAKHADRRLFAELRALPEGDAPAIQEFLRGLRPYHAHRILRPFLDAYAVVARVLADKGDASDLEEKKLVDEALALGRQWALQRRIRSAESVSKSLFQNALKLAANRGLLEAGPELAERRRAFARELRDAVRRVEMIQALARARQSGFPT